jgi:hypothetical protein
LLNLKPKREAIGRKTSSANVFISVKHSNQTKEHAATAAANRWRATMNQVIVGVFASYRDGHEALRALQLAGLRRDDAHLYRAGKIDARNAGMLPPVPSHNEDEAEYAAHGEHQGVVGARHRFWGAELAPRIEERDAAHPKASGDERTLLVIRMTDDIKPGAIGDMLHEHGAVAVKDATGRWRFSPFRNAGREP